MCSTTNRYILSIPVLRLGHALGIVFCPHMCKNKTPSAFRSGVVSFLPRDFYSSTLSTGSATSGVSTETSSTASVLSTGSPSSGVFSSIVFTIIAFNPLHLTSKAYHLGFYLLCVILPFHLCPALIASVLDYKHIPQWLCLLFWKAHNVTFS